MANLDGELGIGVLYRRGPDCDDATYVFKYSEFLTDKKSLGLEGPSMIHAFPKIKFDEANGFVEKYKGFQDPLVRKLYDIRDAGNVEEDLTDELY